MSMKNRKLLVLLCAVALTMFYFISTYTTGKKICHKLNLENANTVVVAYDNGGTAKAPENFTLTLTQNEKAQLLDYLKSLKLKKYTEDYRTINSWERYAFDFQFDNGRTVVYLSGNEFIDVASNNAEYYVKYSIVK